ncbi:MAG: hypothetical protein ABIH64_01415 [Nanoarchaeota archaeon]
MSLYSSGKDSCIYEVPCIKVEEGDLERYLKANGLPSTKYEIEEDLTEGAIRSYREQIGLKLFYEGDYDGANTAFLQLFLLQRNIPESRFLWHMGSLALYAHELEGGRMEYEEFIRGVNIVRDKVSFEKERDALDEASASLIRQGIEHLLSNLKQ